MEFKEVKGNTAVKTITNTADTYAVAFLNSEGGSVFWGIRDDDGAVLGVRLSHRQRDELRRVVTSKLQSIQPPLDPTCFRIEIHQIAGEAVPPDTVVVELIVPASGSTSPHYTASNEAYVRVDAANQKMNGPQLTDWIKKRLVAQLSPASIKEQSTLDLIRRIRQIFAAHGLEHAHLARFFQLRRAPFTIALSDLRNDGALLSWLEESKIAWLADVFHVRRAWIDGEDDQIYKQHYFDKRPRALLSTLDDHLKTADWEATGATPEAYFIRWGGGWNWRTRGDFHVLFVFAVPLARFSNERIIFRHVSDFTPYPWNHADSHVQLRAWAELLLMDRNILIQTCEAPYALGESLEKNTRFWKDLLDDP
ncbi:MAG: ATP-binding protein, partial [Rhodospirillales bacterium]|nr:ATP-binding protein [Acetobacter sp.]